MTNPFYSVMLFISGLISFSVAVIAWRRRPIAGTTPLAITMGMMALWSWMYAIWWLTPSTSVKFFWLGWAFIGVTISSPAFLAMAIEFTGHQNWLTRKFYASIFALPILGMLMYVTDPWLGLFFGEADIISSDDLLRGGLGLLFVGINGYICTFGAVYLLFRYFLKISSKKRISIILILIGTSFPFFGTIISMLHLSPFPGLDLTPLVFSLSGICYAYGLFSSRMMDLAPIGRDAVLEKMVEGMLVIDDINRVVDINPSARSFLNADVENPIGKFVTQVFSTWSQKAKFDFSAQSGSFHVQMDGPALNFYDISVTPLVDSTGVAAGRLFVWHDISLEKRSEKKLYAANVHLQQKLEEIEILQEQLHELAIRDSLTGLFNRRFMDETLGREFVRAIREEISLSIVMMDIDKFKQANDIYGHAAGDEVLRVLGEILLQNVRQSDFACRYGGDEILVIMPNAPSEDAVRRAHQLRQVFSKLEFEFNGSVFQTSLSMGVASFPTHAQTVEELLRAADQALYAEKGVRNI